MSVHLTEGEALERLNAAMDKMPIKWTGADMVFRIDMNDQAAVQTGAQRRGWSAIEDASHCACKSVEDAWRRVR